MQKNPAAMRLDRLAIDIVPDFAWTKFVFGKTGIHRQQKTGDCEGKISKHLLQG
jgi:hypothetical protein